MHFSYTQTLEEILVVHVLPTVAQSSFFVRRDVLLRENANSTLESIGNDICNTIRVAAVVEKACEAAVHQQPARCRTRTLASRLLGRRRDPTRIRGTGT